MFYFLSEDIIFTLTNSVDPDEMQHYAAFHQGLHCLQNTRLVVSDCRLSHTLRYSTIFTIMFLN